MTKGKPVSHKSASSPRRIGRGWLIWVIIGAVIVLAAGAYLLVRNGKFAAPAPTPTPTLTVPESVSVDGAYYLYANNAASFLDVRSAKDWYAYHIMNSISIPLDQLAGRLNELPQKGVIVVVDQAGEAAPQARDLLRQKGFITATSMDGGMDAWVQRLYPFVGTAPY